MKQILLFSLILSGSLLAFENLCEGLEIKPNPTFVASPGDAACKPAYNEHLDRIVIRKPGYEAEGVANTLEAVAAHEIDKRKWCAVGGHYYVYGNGTIVEGRPTQVDIEGKKWVMQGANEVNQATGDGNSGKLGIQVLLDDQQALSTEFIGNFTQLLMCQMQRFSIAKDKVKTHFYAQFHPGQYVQDLLNQVLGQKEDL